METVTWWKHIDGNIAAPSPRFETQETDPASDAPDMNPLPSPDRYDIPVDEVDDIADDSGVPPFTGEDVEDVGRPRRRERRDLPTA